MSIPVELRQMASLAAMHDHAPEINKAIEYKFPDHFFKLPIDADATFSTNLGTQPKRNIEQPPPAPLVRSDIEAEIKRKAEQLRSQFPEASRAITIPTDWSYLYHYFDAQDLWVEGASFLYYVLNYMSNENVRLDNEDRMKAILEEQKYNDLQIFDWAARWINCNVQRIERVPVGSTPLLTIFTKAEMEQFGIHEMSHREKDSLNYALGVHHQRYADELMAAVAARKQMAQPVMVSPVFHHIPPQQGQHMQHHQPQPVMQHLQHAQHISPPQHAQHAQMIATHGMARGIHQQGEQYLGSPMVPVQSVSPQNYQQFMTNQRHLAVGNTIGREMDRPEHNVDRWQARARGQSNESAHGRGGNWRSSDPVPGRKGFSNDARKWEQPFDKRQVENQAYESHNSNKQGYQKQPVHNRQQWSKSNDGIPANAPFLGHPSARVNYKSSTFYYVEHALERAKNQAENQEYYSTRTLYVTGATQNDFVTHTIHQIFSRYGPVDAISYLYPGENNGVAFIMYAESDPLSTAISCLNDFPMESGRCLRVKLPDKTNRSRSGSLNSQYSSHYQNNYNGRGHGNRHQSLPHQTYNRRYIPSPAASSPEGSADNQLTDGFKAQLSPPSFILPVGPVNQTNLGTVDNAHHQPLSTISSYSNVLKKGNNELSYEKSRGGDKENIPMVSHHESPISTPRKESSNHHSGNKGKGKNNKKGSKQNTSTRPTPAMTPIKSRSELNLTDALPRLELDLSTLKQAIAAIEGPTTQTSQASDSTQVQPPKEDLSDTLRKMILEEVTTQAKELPTSTVEPSKEDHRATNASETPIEAQTTQEVSESQAAVPKKKPKNNKNKNKHRNPEKPDPKQTPSPAASTKANSVAGSSDTTPKAPGNNKQQQRQAKHTQKSSNGSNNSFRKTDAQAMKTEDIQTKLESSDKVVKFNKSESKEKVDVESNKIEFRQNGDAKLNKSETKQKGGDKSNKPESKEKVEANKPESNVDSDINPNKVDDGNSTPTQPTRSASKESLNSNSNTPKQTDHGSTPTKQTSHGNFTPPRNTKSASKEKAEASPPAIENNIADWPALAPAKSPVMDGKRPAAMITRSTKIVPVIPLSMERRRQS